MSLSKTLLSRRMLEVVVPRSLARNEAAGARPRWHAKPSLPSRIAVIGNYLPRHCEIATFTTDMCEAISSEYGSARLLALPVNDTEQGYDYPARVRWSLAQDDVTSYQEAAEFLNFHNIDMVCLQHEYGIFGGPAGSHILHLLRGLKMPVVTTLHTVLREPDPDQLRVMEEIGELSDRLIVMSQLSSQFLQEIFKVPGSKIDLVPHGVPDLPFLDPNFYKDRFELQQYVVTYTSYSQGGPGVSLALTKDFRSFELYGVIMPPDDKGSALLPRRIDGYWALIHRPMTPLGAHMWISYSRDLRHWGRHRLMLEARRGAWWDANKIGLSPPPIETSRGWLVLYHGVRHTPSGCLYRLGLALFDLENPEKCLLRGDSWIFGPEADYERNGDVNDVVFPCGYTMDPDGDTVNIYYGAADCSIALARASVRALLEWLDANGNLERRRAQDV